jgi:hypothetical protein
MDAISENGRFGFSSERIPNNGHVMTKLKQFYIILITPTYDIIYDYIRIKFIILTPAATSLRTPSSCDSSASLSLSLSFRMEPDK